MVQDFPVMLSCAFTLIGLSGLFTTLKKSIRISKDPLPPGADPSPPSTPPKNELPALDMTTARAAGEYILAIFVEASWEGILSLAAVVVIALVSGFIVMVVDLSLPAMIGLSLVSLAAAGLSVKTISRRQAIGSWLPPGVLGKKGDPVPVPDQIPACTGVQVSAQSRQAATDLPEEASLATLERYWVVEPYSFVKIERVRNEGFTYIVIEPPISQKEKTILMETYAHLRDIIIYDNTEKGRDERIDPVAVARIIRQFDPDITDERVAILNYYIKRDLSGYGPLEVLMRDPALEDLSCNGHDLPVFIFHRTYGSLPTSIYFTESELNQFVLKLAQKANKQMSLSNPMVDATLPDGARIQITYSEVVSTKGSSFTIRKFRAEPMTPLDLIRFGTYDAQTLAFLWLAIEHRKSLLVVGGTASGKTSMMNAVSLFIPQNAKVVSLEDTREIQLPHRNWLPTQTRELNAEGIKGDIDLFSLLKACMRQRPEYIIVGEVRGVEAQTLFQAMNSGHATLSTIHAGSVYEAINRLTHDPINVPPVMFQALDLVVVQSIYTLGKTRIRRCLSIHEIEVTKSGEINPILLFEWDIQHDTFKRVFQKSRVLEEIAFHCGWDAEELERQIKKREEFFRWALDVEPPTLMDLANAINDMGD
ncbi:type II/IV secretion system ATPase subunit [Methanoregula sp.]|uniref:type II/IV secretion system ATPase subunit n=1 Tax=Methanoregula sp. TaxID=2052170 RepID=UPI003C74A4BA